MSSHSIGSIPPLRVAIIGYGSAGSIFHAPLIAATPGMQVTAVVTAQSERQQLVHSRYPMATVYPHTDGLWQHAANYDLAVIATPNKTHLPLGLAALAAGLPVVIDKPLAGSVEDAEQLLAASQRAKKLLTVFQNRRWDTDFLTVRKVLAANMLGPVTRYESRFERYRLAPRPTAWRESADPAAAGGLLYDLGSHLIDQALLLFGKPTQIYAEVMLRRPHTQTDDDTFVALHFENGVIAHLWMSLVARLPAQRLRVSGLHGTFEKWGLDPQEDALRAGAHPGSAGWGIESREFWGRISTSNSQDGLHLDGHIESIPGSYEHYYALLRDALITKSPPPVDPTSAIEVLRVIAAAQQSAQQKQVIAL